MNDVTVSGTVATTRDIIAAIISAGEPLLDDTDRFAIVQVAIEAMACRLRSLGTDPDEVDAAQAEILDLARDSYVEIWIRHAYEDEGDSVDEEFERRDALRAFRERWP